MEELVDNLSHLLESGDFSDTTLILDGTHRFNVHKVIIAARSPFFAGLFRNPNKKNKNLFELNDNVSPELFRAFLSYLYRGQVKIASFGVAVNLFRLSHFYQVVPLMQQCRNFIDSHPLDLSEIQDLDTLRLLLSVHTVTLFSEFQNGRNLWSWRFLKTSCY